MWTVRFAILTSYTLKALTLMNVCRHQPNIQYSEVSVKFIPSEETGMVERLTISMDEELYDEIRGELEYGDSLSAWMREAAKRRMEGEEGNRSAITGVTAD